MIFCVFIAKVLHNIFKAMQGKRIFDRFGFNLPQQPTPESTVKWVNNYEKFVFLPNSSDWVNQSTGECLTGYVVNAELNHLLTNCINKTKY